MKSIGLDTSAVNYFYEKKVSAQDLNTILYEKNLIPYVSPYVLYELARTFPANRKDKAMAIFSFLEILNPKYTITRDLLYHAEYAKMRSGESVNFAADESLTNLIHQGIKHYARGGDDPSVCLNFFVNERQSSWKETREEQWTHRDDSRKKIICEKYGDNFEAFFSDYWCLLCQGEHERLNFFREVVAQATEQQIILTDKEIGVIANNPNDYPAIYTCVRHHGYLNFLTDLQELGNAPSEDRFTDSTILIEYSYCDIFVSNDQALIDKHAKNTNPRIELMKIGSLFE